MLHRTAVENLKMELKELSKRKNTAEKIEKEVLRGHVEWTYWHMFNSLNLSLHEAADFRDDLEKRIEYVEKELDQLKHKNVLADMLSISFDGPFGKISGLRLGSTPEQTVEWAEINAAWGQAALLLDILAKSIKYSFDGGDTLLDPRGSFSRMYEKSKGYSDLYGPASKILCVSFDRAQVAFLQCIKKLSIELCRRLGCDEQGRERFSLRYPIEGDRVGGYSIRYGLARDKAWTKALRYMLADVKICLLGCLECIEKENASGVRYLPREGPLAQRLA